MAAPQPLVPAEASRPPRVLISGASIAGPALARCLGRNGFSVTIVEKSPAIRPGGQAVDFKGPTHIRLLRALGIHDDVYANATKRCDWRIVDAKSKVKAVVPGEFTGGTVEILRGDLAEILYEHSKSDATYIFGDEVVALSDLSDPNTGVISSVKVTFKHAPPAQFDLVVGCDGVHSSIRRLVWGSEDNCLVRTGYYYAVSSSLPSSVLEGLPVVGEDDRAIAYMYSEPGRSVVIGGHKAPSLFLFKATTTYDRKVTNKAEFVGQHFKGCGWRAPAAVEGMLKAQSEEGEEEIYMDELVRTKLKKFTKPERRVALVGDAGYANTLGGFGTGLALMGAYRLAGELVKALKTHEVQAEGAREDHTLDFSEALEAYDRGMLAPIEPARNISGGPSFLAPSSWFTIWLRNLTFSVGWMTAGMIWMANHFATDDCMPEYDMV